MDMEAELATLNGGDQHLTGRLLKVQVKGSRSVSRRGGHVSLMLERAYIDYAEQFRLPVVLVVVDTATRAAWWLWLQEWILQNELRLAKSSATSLTVRIPDHQTLEEGLERSLIHIALGENPSSLIISLRELAVTAGAANNVGVVQGIFDFLDQVAAPSRAWALEKTIDSLTGLGPNRAFVSAQQFVPQLVAIVAKAGPS